MNRALFSIAVVILNIEKFATSKSNFGYQQMPRGGHLISNGRYQNDSPQQYQHQQSNQYQRPQPAYHNPPNYNRPQASYNVIGNSAENTFGGAAVNSIIGSRFHDTAVNSIVDPSPSPGSTINIIGNKASNTFGGFVNSVDRNPFGNLPGLSSAYSNPIAAQYTNNALRNVFGNPYQPRAFR